MERNIRSQTNVFLREQLPEDGQVGPKHVEIGVTLVKVKGKTNPITGSESP
jgi:hypothetical protein